MKLGHWVGLLALLAIGYYVGANYPGFWKGVSA